MVVVNSVAGAERTLSRAAKQLFAPTAIPARGVRKGEAGSEVSVVRIPIGLASIRLSGQAKTDEWIVGQSFHHVRTALLEPVAQAEGGGHFLAGGLIGRQQQGVPQAIGHGQVGLQTPGILPVPLPFSTTEVPGNRRSFGERGKSLGQI